MSLNEVHFSIVFDSASARQRVQSWFDVLSESGTAFNQLIQKELGIKTKFKGDDPFLESIYHTELGLELHFNHSSSFRFPTALIKALPGAELIVQEVINDVYLSGKKSYFHRGNSIDKNQLLEILDQLEPSVAFVLATTLGVRAATKYYNALPDPHASYANTLLFWHMLKFVSHYPAVQKLLSKCNFKTRSEYGDSVLHYACTCYGQLHSEDIDWLVAQGSDVNAINGAGDTPLLVASQLPIRRSFAIRSFLAKGADPNQRDQRGLSATHHIVRQRGFSDLVGALRHAKADFNAVSPLGSPLWLANKSDRADARKKLWPLNLQLLAPEQAYQGDNQSNLLTASHHHDVAAMARYFPLVTLDAKLSAELCLLACYYQCEVLFALLRDAGAWHIRANAPDPQYGEKYAALHLGLTHESGLATYDMLVSILAQSDTAELAELAQTRDFAIICSRVLHRLPERAHDFFSLLARQGLDLSALLEAHNFSVEWGAEQPSDVISYLSSLRELGLTLSGARTFLLKIKTPKATLEWLCGTIASIDAYQVKPLCCPQCEWVPLPASRWQCTPNCGMVWNTFETKGKCPRCHTQWQDTMCLSCGKYSRHAHWYNTTDRRE